MCLQARPSQELLGNKAEAGDLEAVTLESSLPSWGQGSLTMSLYHFREAPSQET